MRQNFCLTKNDIESKMIQNIDYWIYQRCRDIAYDYKMYPDMLGFIQHVTKTHYRKLLSVSVEKTINNTIIIMFNYIKNQPARVYFVEMTDEMSYSDYIKSRIFEDYTKINLSTKINKK